MCAKFAFVDCDSLSRRVDRLRFARNVKNMDTKDAKVALDVIIRPSVQLWKLVLGPSDVVFTPFKRPKKPPLLRGDSTSSASSMSLKKVRFDEKPVTISRRGFFGRYAGRKDACSSPSRPCLVIRENSANEASEEPSAASSSVTDAQSVLESVYEDCLSDDPSFLIDLQVFEDGGNDDDDKIFHTRQPPKPKHGRRRSEFYHEMEPGIATFDRAGYANYCLSRWLDKKREEARIPQKLVFEDPALLPWPSRARTTLALPSSIVDNPITDITNAQRLLSLSSSTLPVPVCRTPRSLPWRIFKYVEDELQNAIVVLIIGLFIHICLFFFLVYDILTRGLMPSDD